MRSRPAYALLAGAIVAAAGCADLIGPSGPYVTVSLGRLPPGVAARALRVTIAGQSTQVPAPPASSQRSEWTVRGPGFGMKSVQVVLLGPGVDTLASLAFAQSFERNERHWVSGIVGVQRPTGTCVGVVAAVPVQGSAVDTLFVMYGGLPDGAVC